MTRRVAVVTGSNKGIGLQVVKILSSRFDGDVFLCSRDQIKGSAAVEQLKETGLKPLFFKLDICDQNDIQRLKSKLETEYNGIDVLINNAAILLPERPDLTDEQNLENQVNTIKTNYFATAAVCDTLLPIVKPGGRMVNVTSSGGMLKMLKNEAIAKTLSDPQLTRETLDQVANQYIEDLKRGQDEMNGWPVKGFAYLPSKILVSALTWIQQRDMAPKNVAVFAAHPGFVQTDMTQGTGEMTAEQGAESIVFAALEAQPGDQFKCKIIFPGAEARDWQSENVFVEGLTADQVIGYMKQWMKKLGEP